MSTVQRYVASVGKRLAQVSICRSKPCHFDRQDMLPAHIIFLRNLHTTSPISSTNPQSTTINSAKFDPAVAWVLKHPHDVKLHDWHDVLNELLARRRFDDFDKVWQSWYSIQSFEMSRCQPDPIKRSMILVSTLETPTPAVSATEVMTRLNQWGLGYSSAAHDLLVETYLAANDVEQAKHWFDDLIVKGLPRDDRSHKLELELLKQSNFISFISTG